MGPLTAGDVCQRQGDLALSPACEHAAPLGACIIDFTGIVYNVTIALYSAAHGQVCPTRFRARPSTR